MNKEAEIHLEIVDRWRRDARMSAIKFFALFFLGCVAVIVGVHCLGEYMVEHKPIPTVHCNKQTYNGHDYLFLSTSTGQKGIVHDPDGACHKSAEHRQKKPQKTEGERFLIMPTVKETSNGTVTIIAK